MIIGNRHVRTCSRAVLRVVTVAALASAATLLGTPSAYAGITTPGATAIADALKATDTVVTGASWVTTPPSTDPLPNGVGDSALDGFPTDGSTFAILTTGDATLADNANSSTGSGANIGGGNVRGDTDFDVSILKVDFTVGAGMNCMRFDFRFFSEEYPEFLNGTFNDAFIAELDSSTWTTSGSAITAGNNFAFDPAHQPISINAAGNTSMSGDPNGTTYDGATPVLTAAHEVTPGGHSLYLSIFDQGDPAEPGDDFTDHLYDSAVFVDNLVVGHAANPDEQCQPGAAPKMFALTLTPPTAQNPVNTPHTVTATLEDISPAGPVEGGKILFSTSGAHSVTGSDTTDSAGEATFTYTGTIVGTDVITACYDIGDNDTCDEGEPFASVSKTWVAGPGGGGGDGGGGNGLPITGRATGLIAGVGALVLALGLAGYVVIRRRRVRFIAE